MPIELSPLTEAEIAELERSLEAVRPGEWAYLPWESETLRGRVLCCTSMGSRTVLLVYDDEDNCGRIAVSARNALPRLLAEVRRLRAIEIPVGVVFGGARMGGKMTLADHQRAVYSAGFRAGVEAAAKLVRLSPGKFITDSACARIMAEQIGKIPDPEPN